MARRLVLIRRSVEQMDALEAGIQTRISDREAASSDHRARQSHIRDQLDRPTLARFDRLIRGRDGVAVSDVINQTCAMCRISVAPQTHIRLLRMETLEYCHSCLRIIIHKASLQEQENADA